jgi:hypothetical protein
LIFTLNCFNIRERDGEKEGGVGKIIEQTDKRNEKRT